MMELGIGNITATPEELDKWFCSLKDNDARLREIAEKAAFYVSKNAGATRRVVNKIKEELCAKN